MPVTTLEIEVNGRSRTVAVEPLAGAPGRFRVTWDETVRVVDARRLDAETLSLVLVEGGSGSHQVRCVQAGPPDAVDVHVGGAVLRARVDDGRTWLAGQGGAAGGAGGEGRVAAPMPGKITRILVQPGEEVSAGQAVVVVEAMKMENELGAPQAGRVADVQVAEGDPVDAGAVLVVIEPAQ